VRGEADSGADDESPSEPVDVAAAGGG